MRWIGHSFKVPQFDESQIQVWWVDVKAGLTRTLTVALLLSLLVHVVAFTALARKPVASKTLNREIILYAKKKELEKKDERKALHFQLIDTPDSAESPAPPEKTNLISDKNTRAQDRFQGDRKLTDTPHMEGTSKESKDTRPQLAIAQPLAPPAGQPRPPAQPATPLQVSKTEPMRKAGEKSSKEAEKPVEKPAEGVQQKTPAEPENKPMGADDRVTLVPQQLRKEQEPQAQEKRLDTKEPEKKEVIQLAKKMPDPAPLSIPTPPPAAPRIISVVHPNNAEADAEITGEPSFAASRHFFGEYLLKMKKSVEQQWISQLVTKYTGILRSKAVIDFKIQPDGHVTDLAINSSEGEPYFPLICVGSINDAQPFEKIPYTEIPGLPDEFVNKPLNIRFTFQCN